MGVNRVTSLKRSRTARTTGGVILATSLLALGLVTAGTTSGGAAEVNTKIDALCSGADDASRNTLNSFAGILGGNTIAITLQATAADIPENAAIGDKIDANFAWTGTLSQQLIDTAAGIGASINAKNITAQMAVKGPSDIDAFSITAPDISVTPAAGVAANLALGNIGGEITTTGGGIITYRVGSVSFTTELVASLLPAPVVLNITCSPTGSNLIAKTTVKDPDAPTFTPELIPLSTTSGGVATVDLLGGNPAIISAGKTPLLRESLKIAEQPAAGQASITNGVFSFTAPTEAGTYSTTVEICGVPKDDSAAPGVSEIQEITLGENWTAFGGGGLDKRPIAFTLKFGDQETPLIWATNINPLLPTPTEANWAPEGTAGVVGQYAFLTTYTGISASQVQSALESLSNVGTGNVEVVAEKNNPVKPNLVTNFKVNFRGALAEQDVPGITLGQWYSVLPQEGLEGINAGIAALASTPTVTTTTVPGGPPPVDPLGGLRGQALNDFIAAKILDGSLTKEESDAFLAVVIEGLTAAAPALLAAITALFPQKINPVAVPVVAGEAPTKAQPLCSQAIIEVTVGADVLGISIEQVGGANGAQGLGFVG